MAVLLGASFGAFAASVPARGATATCFKQPGTTLASSAQARVYETEPAASEAGTLTRLWACRAGSAKRVSLVDAYQDPFGAEQSYSSVRLAGHRVAFLVTSTPPEGGTSREVQRVEIGSPRRDTATVGRRVTLVMSAAGGLAWIESRAVRALGSSGARVLDAGPVETASLRRAGRSSLSWVRDGVRRTARVR